MILPKALSIFLKIFLPLLFGFFLVYLFFETMPESDLQYFYAVMKRANYWWFLLALILSFCGYLIRAYRWKYALNQLGHNVPFWNRFHATMIGYLVNMTIPRAGEASRALMLYRSNKIPFAEAFGSIVVERVIDLVMLALVALATFFLANDDFMDLYFQLKALVKEKEGISALKIILVSGFALTVVLMGVVYLKNPKWRNRTNNFVKGLWSGVRSTFQSNYVWSYLFWTFLMWTLYIVYFALAFFALPETAFLPLKAILLSFVAGALGISFTNGGLGSFPLLVGLVVAYYLDNSHAHSIGNALGMLIWISQTVFLISLGLISLFLLPKPFKKEDEQTQLS